jgi:Prealbumin-like fold domain
MSRLLNYAALIVFGTGSALTSAAGAGQAPAPQPAALAARSVVRTPTRVLALNRPGVPTVIQGNALNSTNGQLPNAIVRLRDARFGRIVDTEVTDQSGLFTFHNVDPGTYIVEMMGNDSTVLAASQLLNVNGGEVVSAIVKLPFRVPPFAGAMGVNSTPTASLLAAQAAANGVIAVATTTPVSPNQ